MDSMTPSQNQIWGLVRQLVPIIGTFVTLMGWAPSEVVNVWVATISAASGPIIILVGLVLSLRANTKSSIIRAAAAFPETKVENQDGDVVVRIKDRTLAEHAVVASGGK